MQILTPEQAADFAWDIFDITKVRPHKGSTLKSLFLCFNFKLSKGLFSISSESTANDKTPLIGALSIIFWSIASTTWWSIHLMLLNEFI